MPFNINDYAKAPLKLEYKIYFEHYSGQEVFDILDNPELISEWYLLAENVQLNSSKGKAKESFTVDLTFFGHITEEVLYKSPPHHYVYSAKGDDFPIDGYIAEIEIITEPCDNKGVMIFKVYYKDVLNSKFKRIIPILFPVINEASINKLAEFIGGYKVESINHGKLRWLSY
ncbi:MAG: hypothetical protein JKX75_09260 [Gammaproteobacteria bacterium]|nr:hypothetical protein [Gammaproteobacteria bacterium]